jgi:FG-GAP repeat protein
VNWLSFFTAALITFLVPTNSHAAPEWTWLHVAYGTVYWGQHGAAVAWIGDIDADGREDFVVGQPSGSCEGPGCPSGAATVYSGSSGRVIYELSVGEPSDEFGLAVTGLTDIDGDSVPDFAIAAPEREIGGTGKIFIYSGATGAALRIVEGAGGAFGTSIAVIGDMDGDGLPDLLIGAPYLNVQTGAAYVVSPVSGVVLRTFGGTQTFSRFGDSVGGCGDLDGDGIADALVADPHNEGYGSLKAFSGATGSQLFEVDSLQYWFDPVVQGVLDLNGDGVRDFALGGRAGTQYGFAAIYSGITGLPLIRVEAASGNGFGSAVACGTLTGQPAPDLAVGAPEQGSTGAVHLYWTATAALEFSVYGETWGSRFGASLAVGGDVNGDGRPDLLVGAPTTTHDNLLLGAVYVFALVDRLPARSFLDGGGNTVHLGGGAGDVCFRLEPPSGYQADDVVLPSIVLRPTAVSYREIHAIPASSGTVPDSDGHFVPETLACFSRQDLQVLFGDLPPGRHEVSVTLECNLTNGARVSAPMALALEVPAVLRASVAPTPMSSQGTLTFRTTTPGAVRVSLFDARGRHIRDLMPTSSTTGGYHNIPLDGRGATGERLPGGVYFFRIESPDGIVTGRVVLLR